MGYLGTIVVLDIKVDVNAEQDDEKALVITCEESKATVAAWSYLSKYILAGHEDGSVSQYDAKVCTTASLTTPLEGAPQGAQTFLLSLNPIPPDLYISHRTQLNVTMLTPPHLTLT